MVQGGARLLGLVAALLGALAAGALAAPSDANPSCGNFFLTFALVFVSFVCVLCCRILIMVA